MLSRETLDRLEQLNELPHYFVSDLHLGYDKSEDFHADRAYLSFLEQSGNHWVVGDGLELWQGKQEDIKEAHQDIFRRWRKLGDKFNFVRGNHDDTIDWQVKPDINIIVSNSVRILVLHGHQCDKYNRCGTSLGRIVTQVVGLMEKYIHKDMDTWLEYLYNLIQKRVADYNQEMALLAKEHNCSIVIYGHHHLAGTWLIDNIVVMNCGTWTKCFVNGYPFIKLHNGIAELKWWHE